MRFGFTNAEYSIVIFSLFKNIIQNKIEGGLLAA